MKTFADVSIELHDIAAARAGLDKRERVALSRLAAIVRFGEPVTIDVDVDDDKPSERPTVRRMISPAALIRATAPELLDKFSQLRGEIARNGGE